MLNRLYDFLLMLVLLLLIFIPTSYAGNLTP